MRNALAIALLGALSLTACDKAAEEQQGLTNWEKAPPLLAGIDEGETVMAPGVISATGPAAVGQGAVAPGAPGARGAAGPAPVLKAAPAGTVPVRKAGLWQTTSNNGRGPQSGQLCVSDDTELRRGIFSAGGGRGGAGCDPKIAKTASGWTSTMSCTRSFGDNTIKTASSQTLSGDLNVRYSVKGTSSTSGGPNPEMNGTRQTSATGVYQGPCPAGMKPGDLKGADGQVRNILEQGRGGGGGFGGGRREGGGEGGGRREGGRQE